MAWSDLLFLHWPMEPAVLRPHIPAGLEIDTWNGSAWIGVVPFRMTGVRPVLAPPIPGLSAFLELNVRTYVTRGEEEGVYFFSLDASSAIAVWLARTMFHLPYFRARMGMEQPAARIRYTSRRTHQGAAEAAFECEWNPRGPLPRPRRGDLLHFLTERYRLFCAHRGRVFCCRIWHEPWSLRDAGVNLLRSSMVEAAGLPTPVGDPLAHHADMLAVQVWPLREAAPEEAAAAMLDPALAPPPAT